MIDISVIIYILLIIDISIRSYVNYTGYTNYNRNIKKCDSTEKPMDFYYIYSYSDITTIIIITHSKGYIMFLSCLQDSCFSIMILSRFFYQD